MTPDDHLEAHYESLCDEGFFDADSYFEDQDWIDSEYWSDYDYENDTADRWAHQED